MNEQVQLGRAAEADAILQSPLIVEALASYEKEITEAWKTSKNGDAEGREKLHHMLAGAKHFEAYLMQLVNTGKLIRAKVRPPSTVERVRQAIGRR